jgi:hypothetical protein
MLSKLSQIKLPGFRENGETIKRFIITITRNKIAFVSNPNETIPEFPGFSTSILPN